MNYKETSFATIVLGILVIIVGFGLALYTVQIPIGPSGSDWYKGSVPYASQAFVLIIGGFVIITAGVIFWLTQSNSSANSSHKQHRATNIQVACCFN